MCLRASLALLAYLERQRFVERPALWRFAEARAGGERGPERHGEHSVVEHAGLVIDLTAVQFGEQPGIRVTTLDDEAARWHHAENIDPDAADAWDSFTRLGVHPNWRLLLDVGPPGDLPEWPYPFHALDQRSPWHPG